MVELHAFQHPSDEQLRHVDIFFSNYYNLQSVYFEYIPGERVITNDKRPMGTLSCFSQLLRNKEPSSKSWQFLKALFGSFLCMFIITIIVIKIIIFIIIIIIIIIMIILVYILRFKFLLNPNPKLSIKLKTRIIITMNSQNTLLILISKLTVSLISSSFSSLFHQQHHYLYQYFKYYTTT